MDAEELPDWERLLAAERHVLEDLRPRFDQVRDRGELAAPAIRSRNRVIGRIYQS